MSGGEIILALHLDQPRGRTLKFEGSVTARIKRRRQRIRCREQFDPLFVECVDEGDKAGRFVAIFRPECRYADNEDRVERTRYGQIIGGAARLAAYR